MRKRRKAKAPVLGLAQLAKSIACEFGRDKANTCKYYEACILIDCVCSGEPMHTFVVNGAVVSVPPWVVDVASFRNWAHSDEFPESGRICFLNGDVWVDMSKEQLIHNQIKGVIASVLMALVARTRMGLFLPDGYLFSNIVAALSTNPDGIYVSNKSLQLGKVTFVEGVEEGLVELEGSPDMVLEVVSPGSVEKDTVTLMELYWQAGVREYWLVDTRGEQPTLEIQRHTDRGFVSVRSQRGWTRSGVFAKSFRIRQQTTDLGYPRIRLMMR